MPEHHSPFHQSGVTMAAAMTDLRDLTDKPSSLADVVLGNCTTVLPFRFQFHERDVSHTVVVGPTGKGMSALGISGAGDDNR